MCSLDCGFGSCIDNSTCQCDEPFGQLPEFSLADFKTLGPCEDFSCLPCDRQIHVIQNLHLAAALLCFLCFVLLLVRYGLVLRRIKRNILLITTVLLAGVVSSLRYADPTRYFGFDPLFTTLTTLVFIACLSYVIQRANRFVDYLRSNVKVYGTNLKMTEQRLRLLKWANTVVAVISLVALLICLIGALLAPNAEKKPWIAPMFLFCGLFSTFILICHSFIYWRVQVDIDWVIKNYPDHMEVPRWLIVAKKRLVLSRNVTIGGYFPINLFYYSIFFNPTMYEAASYIVPLISIVTGGIIAAGLIFEIFIKRQRGSSSESRSKLDGTVDQDTSKQMVTTAQQTMEN